MKTQFDTQGKIIEKTDHTIKVEYHRDIFKMQEEQEIKIS